MTGDELGTLLSFLTGGLLVGLVGRWLDLLVAYVKGRG